MSPTEIIITIPSAGEALTISEGRLQQAASGESDPRPEEGVEAIDLLETDAEAAPSPADEPDTLQLTGSGAETDDPSPQDELAATDDIAGGVETAPSPQEEPGEESPNKAQPPKRATRKK